MINSKKIVSYLIEISENICLQNISSGWMVG